MYKKWNDYDITYIVICFVQYPEGRTLPWQRHHPENVKN